MVSSCVGRVSTLSVLVLVSILAFLDRNIFVVLLFQIKNDLQLSLTQVGFLGYGPFGAVVALVSIPIGLLVDRLSYKRLILASCLFFWSLMMMGCGFSSSFVSLAVFRAGVGIGEAALLPCSLCLIKDSFAESERRKALGVFGLAPFIGAGLALGISGVIIAFSKQSIQIPIFGFLKGWQFVFLVLGWCGLVFPLSFLLVKENISASSQVNWKMALRKLAGRWRPLTVFLPFVFLYAMILAAWNTFSLILFKGFDFDPAKAAFVLSILDPCAGISGTFFVQYLSHVLEGRGMRSANVLVMIGCTCVVWAIASVRCFVKNEIAAYVLYGLQQFAMCGLIGLALDMMLKIAPKNAEAVSGGLSGTANNLGFVVGPLAVGIISDFTGNLWIGLFAVSLFAGLSATIIIVIFKLFYEKIFIVKEEASELVKVWTDDELTNVLLEENDNKLL